MKKLLVAIPLIAVIGGAAAPAVIGSKIESAVNQQIALSNLQMEKSIAASPQLSKAKVALDSYEKGYLSSKATGNISFTASFGPSGAKTYTIPFTSDVKHGPYLGEDGFGASRIVTRPDLSGFDLPESINEDTIIIKSLIGFSGDLTDKMTIAPIAFEDGDVQFNFAGAVLNSVSPQATNRATFTGDMTVEKLTVSGREEFVLQPFSVNLDGTGSANFSSGTYSANSSAIEAIINGTEGSFKLSKMTLKGSYKEAKGTDLLPLTNTELSLNNIIVENEDLPQPIQIPQLFISSSMEQNNGTDFDIKAKYSAKLDSSLMTMMRSPVDVKSADIGIDLTGLSVESIEAYYELMQALVNVQNQRNSDAQAIQGQALSIAQLLIKNASAAKVELHANTDEGDFDADIDLGFKPNLDLNEAEIMGLMGAATDPSKLLNILVGRGDVSLSKGITDKAGMTPIIQAMAADFVTLEGDVFKSNMTITDGQLLINGQALPMMGGM